MSRLKGLVNRIKPNLKYHLVDTTAMLVASHHFYSLVEKCIGMSDRVSMNARLNISLIAYAGLGFLYARWRDLSKKHLFKMTDETRESIRVTHDLLYTVLFSGAMMFGLYFLSGEKDLNKIKLGATIMGTTAVMRGPIVGYYIDVFRDLIGLEECKRRSYPQRIKNLKPKLKKAVAAGLVAASVGAMGLVYTFFPDRDAGNDVQAPRVEQTIQVEDSYKSLEGLVCE